MLQKYSNRYRDAERLTGNGTPNIYAEKGEEGNRSNSIETKMRKRSKETDRYCLKEGVLVIALDKFNYSL